MKTSGCAAADAAADAAYGTPTGSAAAGDAGSAQAALWSVALTRCAAPLKMSRGAAVAELSGETPLSWTRPGKGLELDRTGVQEASEGTAK